MKYRAKITIRCKWGGAPVVRYSAVTYEDPDEAHEAAGRLRKYILRNEDGAYSHAWLDQEVVEVRGGE